MLWLRPRIRRGTLKAIWDNLTFLLQVYCTGTWTKGLPAMPPPSLCLHRTRWWRAPSQGYRYKYPARHGQWNTLPSTRYRISASVCSPCMASPRWWCSHPLCTEVGRQTFHFQLPAPLRDPCGRKLKQENFWIHQGDSSWMSPPKTPWQSRCWWTWDAPSAGTHESPGSVLPSVQTRWCCRWHGRTPAWLLGKSWPKPRLPARSCQWCFSWQSLWWEAPDLGRWKKQQSLLLWSSGWPPPPAGSPLRLSTGRWAR